MPDLLALPAGAEVQDAHGLELDVEGNIYLTYRNWNDGIVNNGTDRNCLIRWDPQGLHGTFLAAGGDALCTGTRAFIHFAYCTLNSRMTLLGSTSRSQSYDNPSSHPHVRDTRFMLTSVFSIKCT